MRARIIQFGDEFKKGIFVFPPSMNEDVWNDSVNPSLLELQFKDGSFRALGFEQARKVTKQLTKRFILKESEFDMRKLRDYYYFGIRGGVKRLYVMLEDGSVRWTWAEAVDAPFNSSEYEGNNGKKLGFEVSFVCHEPYFYDAKPFGDTNLKAYRGLPYKYLVEACSLTDILQTGYSIAGDFCSTCDCYNSDCLKMQTCDECLIIVKENLTKYDCSDNACVDNLYTAYNLNLPKVTGTQPFCVLGSAGIGDIQVGFYGLQTNPTISIDSGSFIKYTGNMTASEWLYMRIPEYINNVSDIYYSTNIVGFSIAQVTLQNAQGEISLDLERGNNTITVTGSYHFSFINKYHN